MRGLVVIDQGQAFEIRLTDHKGQLLGAIGGVDRYQDNPDSGRGKLEQNPSWNVGGPYAEVIPATKTLGNQTLGDKVDLMVKFLPSDPPIKVRKYHCVLVL
jgi:hypothetical protein